MFFSTEDISYYKIKGNRNNKIIMGGLGDGAIPPVLEKSDGWFNLPRAWVLQREATGPHVRAVGRLLVDYQVSGNWLQTQPHPARRALA